MKELKEMMKMRLSLMKLNLLEQQLITKEKMSSSRLTMLIERSIK